MKRGPQCGRLSERYIKVACWRLTGEISDAVKMITAGASAYRSTGSTIFAPWYLPILAKAYAELGQFNEASASIAEAFNAIDASSERWCEAEVHRVAGEIALMSPEPETAKAEAYFIRSLE